MDKQTCNSFYLQLSRPKQNRLFHQQTSNKTKISTHYHLNTLFYWSLSCQTNYQTVCMSTKGRYEFGLKRKTLFLHGSFVCYSGGLRIVSVQSAIPHYCCRYVIIPYYALSEAVRSEPLSHLPKSTQFRHIYCVHEVGLQ